MYKRTTTTKKKKIDIKSASTKIHVNKLVWLNTCLRNLEWKSFGLAKKRGTSLKIEIIVFLSTHVSFCEKKNT